MMKEEPVCQTHFVINFKTMGQVHYTCYIITHLHCKPSTYLIEQCWKTKTDLMTLEN